MENQRAYDLKEKVEIVTKNKQNASSVAGCLVFMIYVIRIEPSGASRVDPQQVWVFSDFRRQAEGSEVCLEICHVEFFKDEAATPGAQWDPTRAR